MKRLNLILILLSYFFLPFKQYGQIFDNIGPYGGKLNYLVSNNDTIYAVFSDNMADENQYIYSSSDKGTTWKAFINAKVQGKIEYLAFKQNKIITLNNSLQVYHTINQGKTWEPLDKKVAPTPLKQNNYKSNIYTNLDNADQEIDKLNSIYILNSYNHKILAGNEYGIHFLNEDDKWELYTDTTYGSCINLVDHIIYWKNKLIFNGYGSVTDKIESLIPAGTKATKFDENGHEIKYKLKKDTIYRKIHYMDKTTLFTENDGKTWNPFTITKDLLQVSNLLVDSSFAIAFVNNKDEIDKINYFFTCNYGLTWKKIDKLPIEPNCFLTYKNIFFISDFEGELYQSEDNMKTWKKITPEGDYDEVTKIPIYKMGNFIFYNSSKGLMRSPYNNIKWEYVIKNLNHASIDDLKNINNKLICVKNFKDMLVYENKKWTKVQEDLMYFSLADNLIYVLNKNANLLRSNDGGTNWEDLSKVLPTKNSIKNVITDGDSVIFIITDSLEIFRSINRGDSFQSFDNGLEKSKYNYFHRKENYIILNTSKGNYFTTALGKSWNKEELEVKTKKISLQNFEIKNAVRTDSCFLISDDRDIYTSKNEGIDWQKNTSLSNKNTRLMAANKTTIFAANYDSLFISKDNGTTWTNCIHPFKSITSLESSGKNIFIRATNNSRYSSDSHYYISSDDGKSWQIIQSGIPNQESIHSIAAENRTIFVLGDKLYRTKDLGVTWDELNTPFKDKKLFAIAANDDIVYVSSEKKLYHSRDKGNNWDSVLPNKKGIIKKIALSKAGMFAAFSDSTDLYSDVTKDGVSYSKDGGKTWSTPKNIKFPSEAILKSLKANNNSLYAIITKNNSFKKEYDSLYISQDEGESWINSTEQKNKIYKTKELRITNFVKLGNHLFAGTVNEGIYRSENNGKTWISSNSNLPIKQIYSMAVSGKNLFAIGYDFGYGFYYNHFRKAFISKNLGETWELIKIYNDSIKELDYNQYNLKDESYQIATTENAVLINTAKGLFVSYDNGTSWMPINYYANKITPSVYSPNLLISNNQSFFITLSGKHVKHELTNERNDEGYDTLNSYGVLRSDDGGKTWIKMNKGLINQTVTSLTASNNSVFALTTNGIFKFSNNENLWKLLNKHPEMGYLSFIKTINNILYAGTSEGMFHSKDEGTTWERLHYFSNWTSGNINIIGKNIFAQDEIQNIFYSTDLGLNWKFIPDEQVSYEENNLIKFFKIHKHKILVDFDNLKTMSKNNGKDWKIIDHKNSYDGLPIHTTYSWNRSWNQVTCEDKIFEGVTSKEGYIGTFMSINKGKSWKLINNGIPPNENIHQILKHQKNYFACTSKGLYISSNNGNSWTQRQTTGLPSGIIKELHSNSKKLYATIQILTPQIKYFDVQYSYGYLEKMQEDKLNTVGIYESADNGFTWKSINHGIDGKSIYKSFVTPKSILINTFELDTIDRPIDTTDEYAKYRDIKYISKLYASFDEGLTWNRIFTNLPEQIQVTEFKLKDHIVFLNINGRGYYYSEDFGKTWSKKIQLATSENKSQKINNSIKEEVNMEQEDIISFASSNKNLLTLSTHKTFLNIANTDKRLLHSNNSGKTWKPLNNGLKNKYIQNITVSDKNNNIYLETRNGIYKSTDNAKTWRPCNEGLESEYDNNIFNQNDTIFSLFQQKKLMYLDESENKWLFLKNVEENFSFVPRKEKFTLELKNLKENEKNFRESDVKYKLKKENLIYAVTNIGLFVTRENETKWELIKKHPEINEIAASSKYIAIRSYENIFLSKDEGKTWTEIKNHYATSLEIIEDTLFIGTINQSVLAVKLDKVFSSN